MYGIVEVYLHAFRRHYVEVSVKLHALAALPPILFSLCRRLDGWGTRGEDAVSAGISPRSARPIKSVNSVISFCLIFQTKNIYRLKHAHFVIYF